MSYKSSLLYWVCAIFLSGCQQINGNSLLTNNKNDPSSHVLNKDPKSDELYVRAYLNSFSVPTARSMLEIAGECYTSTYPLHKIIVREGSVLREIIDLSTDGTIGSSIATCKNGKFNLALNVAALKAGTTALTIELEARDGSGNIFTNSIQGISRVSVTRY